MGNGGGYRNRTGLHGFAIRCVTSPPTRRLKVRGEIGETAVSCKTFRARPRAPGREAERQRGEAERRRSGEAEKRRGPALQRLSTGSRTHQGYAATFVNRDGPRVGPNIPGEAQRAGQHPPYSPGIVVANHLQAESSALQRLSNGSRASAMHRVASQPRRSAAC